jgi:rubrerythrin
MKNTTLAAGAASLFWAPVRAEEIHAANHANGIRRFAGLPGAKLESARVSLTRENLTAAIKGESYERDEMSPAFIRQPKSEGNAEASQTFRLAHAAEAEHAKLYAETLANLGKMTASRVFYVRPACRFTTPRPDLKRCPTCATPRECFEQIS